MSKFQICLLIVLSSVFFTNRAIAQNKPLACQGEAAAGLIWESGRWNTTTFVKRQFILVLASDNLTTDSVAKAINNEYPLPQQTFCRSFTTEIYCIDAYGGGIYFSPITLKGAVTREVLQAISPSRRINHGVAF
jgi:hypothetical protein